MPPQPVWVASIATIAAGAVFILSTYLYHRKKRTKDDSSSSRIQIVAPADLYQPVTQVAQYHVCTINSLMDHTEAVKTFLDAVNQLKLIGLDCEWVSVEGQRLPVALLQISSPLSQSCLLFRLNHLQGKLPDDVIKVLLDRNTLKVGVGVLEDAKRLLKDYGIVTHGCLDLRHLARRHLPRNLRTRPLSLRELANIVLGHEMLKNDRIRCGNWEATPLTEEQINYAAEDAIIGSAIFLRIAAWKLQLTRLEFFVQQEKWRNVTSLCQGLVDTYPDNQGNGETQTKSRKKSGRNSRPPTDDQPLSKAYMSRQSVMYHNCRLLAPDGSLLCVCEKRKAQWYIEKEIGVLVCENPMTVRILFEPAGVPGPDREYYLQDKENQCTVCGRKDSYIRKHVVPHEYRRHFPDYLKKHSSHDVILLCIRCHHKSCRYDMLIREGLSERYDAAMCHKTNAQLIEDPVRVKVRSCARALLRDQKAPRIPEFRLRELRDTLMEFFQVDNLDDELLQEAMSMSTKIENENFTGSHGMKVVEAAKQEEGGLPAFERMWRQHFLDTMQPQFLPALWSVDHMHEASVCKKEDRENDKMRDIMQGTGSKDHRHKDLVCEKETEEKDKTRDSKQSAGS